MGLLQYIKSFVYLIALLEMHVFVCYTFAEINTVYNRYKVNTVIRKGIIGVFTVSGIYLWT